MAPFLGSEVAVTCPVATPSVTDVNTKTRVPRGAFAKEQLRQSAKSA
jgi:hypothetical protein